VISLLDVSVRSSRSSLFWRLIAELHGLIEAINELLVEMVGYLRANWFWLPGGLESLPHGLCQVGSSGWLLAWQVPWGVIDPRNG
jgi:hypothetical protein